MNIKQITELLKGYRTLPRIRIVVFGQEDAEEILTTWSARHPRFPLVKRKEVGVALVELPEKIEDYLAGKEKEYLRRRRNRAIRLGYTFRAFDIDEQIDAVMDVNASLGERQGQSIRPAYLDREAVRRFHRRGGTTYGVFDREGRLAAYTYVPICGEIALLSRIFGHGEHLDNGVMQLMVSEVIGEMLKLRESNPRLKWINYDMWYGAADGLRFFKQQLGFRPYRVTWERGAA